jgi:hypothetical protein
MANGKEQFRGLESHLSRSKEGNNTKNSEIIVIIIIIIMRRA